MDIQYVTEHEKTVVYNYMCDGNRPVLRILVHTETLQIWVAAYDTSFVSAMPQKTNGIAHTHVDEDLAAEIGLENATIICMGSVASYVVPRIGTLMARVYCPAPKVKTSK